MKKFVLVGFGFCFPAAWVTAGLEPPQLKWIKLYPPASGQWMSSVQQTSDGGFIVLGITAISSGKEDVYLIRTDASGDALPGWPKVYSIAQSDNARSVRQTRDGGFIVVGRTDEGAFLIRTDASGDVLPGWPKVYGPRDNSACSVQQTSDGGFIVPSKEGLLRTDASGDVLPGWPKPYPYRNNGGSFVELVDDGGFIVAGAEQTDNGLNLWFIRTDASGDVLPGWPRVRGFWGLSSYSMDKGIDGRFTVVGSGKLDPQEARTEVLLMRFRTEGDDFPDWLGTYWNAGATGSLESLQGYSVQQTSDGGFIVSGNVFETLVLVRFGPEGTSITDCNENGVEDSTDIANGTSQDCNCNEIPDECDLESGVLHETNGNGVPDECEPRNFIRGEANDSDRIDIADAVRILDYLFGHKEPLCLDALDVNDDGKNDIADAIYLLSYLFAKGPAPKAPFDEPGVDPTCDSLGCNSSRW